MIRILLALYPREWRRRYAAEMLAHFGCQRIGPRNTLDLVNGAIDAHLHPQWRHRGRALSPDIPGCRPWERAVATDIPGYPGCREPLAAVGQLRR